MKVNLLKAEMARVEQTPAEVAKAIGMNTSTFYRKMKKGVFGTDEAQKIIEYLEIKNPVEIFLE